VRNKKLCLIVSSELTVKSFLLNHIQALSKEYDTNIIVNTNDINFLSKYNLNVKIFAVKIQRKISIYKDIISFIKILSIFNKERFDIIHSITPKAGFLAMLSGTILFIPARIHIFTGQIWATKTGLTSWLLKLIDKLIIIFSTNILADSFSQRDFLIDQKIIKRENIFVLANGSISGVDKKRFKPDKKRREEIRKLLDINDSDLIFLFVGRLKIDKGILDLITAFNQTFNSSKGVHLLFVGPDEDDIKNNMRVSDSILDRIYFVPYTDSPEYYMAASDVFCLPSYREGFGSVIIEAAACGLPAIGSRIYGITDAIDEGKTGMTFEVGNVKELSELLYKYYSSPRLRAEMGHSAQIRAEAMFSAERVTEAWLDYYRTV